MDDAGEGRLRRRRADPAFDAAGLVDGAREHRIAGQFVDRQAFAGDRRLVHTGLAAEHHRIERDAFARTHPHRRADGDLTDRQSLPSAVGLAHLGTVGREREQAADRIARAVHGARLDQFRDRVQGHHHRRFRPLPDHEGTDDGHRHQSVDVQAPMQQGREAFAESAEAGQCNGRRRDGQTCPVCPTSLRQRISDAFGHARQDERGDEARQLEAAWVGVRCIGCGLRIGLGPGRDLETDLANGADRGVERLRRTIDAQAAFAQMKAQAAQTRDALERAADVGFFARAIHGRDAVARAGGRRLSVRRRRRAGASRDRNRFGGRAACAARMSRATRAGVLVGVAMVVV